MANRPLFARSLLLFWGLVGCLCAQESATIQGLVTDASGGGLNEASVVVSNVETGSTRQLLCDRTGRYDVPALPVGRYELRVSKPGFQTALKTGIALTVGQKLEVDVSLAVGELKQVITVEEKTPVVELSTQQTSGLVGERQVKDLPLNGRSYDELMSLNPGIVNYSSERSGGVGSSNSAIGNMFSASGRRPQESPYLAEWSGVHQRFGD